MKCVCLPVLLFLAFIGSCKKAEKPASGVTEAAVGLPFYPSSTEWGTGSRVSETDGVTVAASARETKDAPDKVIAFYKKKLQDPKTYADNMGDLIHTSVIGKTKDGSDAEVLVMRMPQQKTQIFISVRRPKK